MTRADLLREAVQRRELEQEAALVATPASSLRLCAGDCGRRISDVGEPSCARCRRRKARSRPLPAADAPNPLALEPGLVTAPPVVREIAPGVHLVRKAMPPPSRNALVHDLTMPVAPEPLAQKEHPAPIRRRRRPDPAGNELELYGRALLLAVLSGAIAPNVAARLVAAVRRTR